MTAIGTSSQNKTGWVDELAWSGLATFEGARQGKGNVGAVIHNFCADNCIQDFAILITRRHNGRGQECVLLKLGSQFSQTNVKPASFANWQICSLFANTFTPASISHVGGQLKIIHFGNETEELHLLSDERERAFFGEMQANAGFCIPLVNGSGDRALALTTFDIMPQTEKVGSIYFKLLKIFETLELGTSAEAEKAAGRLTSREVECLKWVADGKTSLEIAAITSLSVHTINHYLKICCSKLNAVNRIQAAVVASRQHLI